MSRFGWVDFGEDDRQQMLDIVKLFALHDTRDELGIGTVRDAFANYFFPGTTTIQTRARYFLIVPWIYQDAARRGRAKNWTTGQMVNEVDALERAFIGALKRGGELDGVIGARSGREVQRLPSSVYWPGLATLKIRLFAGSQADLSRWLVRSFKRGPEGAPLHAAELDVEAEQQSDAVWQANLPPKPLDMFTTCTLALTKAEAEYLRERIRFSYSQSLFARFLDADSRPADEAFVWDHPLMQGCDPDLQRAIEDARRFSLLSHGAAYLYNLMLAEKRAEVFGESADDRREVYRDALEQWADGDELRGEWGSLKAWCSDPRLFWTSPGLREWRPVSATNLFVNRWYAILSQCASPKDIVKRAEARSLIREREYFLKHANRARLHNTDALRRWSGAAGTGRLDFRWGIASTLIRDIWTGIHEGDKADA